MIICGDALIELKKLADNSIDCCVTSPPYYQLRDYGVKGQIGLEKTLDYINELKEEKVQARSDGKKELLQDMYNVVKEGKDKNLTISCEDIEKIARRYEVRIRK